MKRITHVGVLVHDLEAAIDTWGRLFGYREIKRMEVPPEGLRSVFLSRDGTPDQFMVELVQVVDENDTANPVARRLREHGEGMLHLCMVDEDTGVAARELQAAGVRFAARPTATGRGDDRLILSPRATNGAMVEILSEREWVQVWEREPQP
jgi:catechol 2,3-dioxygenase-like lactoylglutathione lyase family enzyme